MRILSINFLATIALATTASAQNAPLSRVASGDGFDFSIKNIMRGPELYGRPPANLRWSADGRWIHFLWNEPGTDWREPLRPYRVRAMVDVNVDYQDIVRLQKRLIEVGKTDWSLASYPVEDHGFVRPSSWTDEYRRIFELFESTIARPGGAPRRAAGDGGDR